jgi:hypothetical protein
MTEDQRYMHDEVIALVNKQLQCDHSTESSMTSVFQYEGSLLSWNVRSHEMFLNPIGTAESDNASR